MIRTIVLSIGLVLGLASSGHAASFPAPVIPAMSGVITVGEGCGAGFWRGPHGGCNRFNGPGGNNRGRAWECPWGYHIGPGGQRCFPNQR